MEIRSELDIKRLTRYLKNRLGEGDTIAVDIQRMDAPTNKQLRMINAIPRELAVQAAERGVDGLNCKDFRGIIVDIFLSDYLELMPDGRIIEKRASFKHGLTKHELSNIISSAIEYFNVYFGFNIGLKEAKSESVTPEIRKPTFPQ